MINNLSTRSAWIHNADLTPITPQECKDVSEKGKSKNLIAAYQVAAEGHDLDYFKEMLNDFELAVQQAQEEQEAKAAAKAAKEEKKKKRKSMEVVEGAEDEEMEDAGEKKKSSKKRKKDLESEGEQEKVSRNAISDINPLLPPAKLWYDHP